MFLITQVTSSLRHPNFICVINSVRQNRVTITSPKTNGRILVITEGVMPWTLLGKSSVDLHNMAHTCTHILALWGNRILVYKTISFEVTRKILLVSDAILLQYYNLKLRLRYTK